MDARSLLRDTRLLIGALLLAALITGFFATRWLLQRGSGAVATLTSKTGQTDRDESKSVGDWKVAELTSEFHVGDGVRTGKDSKATLTLDDESGLELTSSTIVRFLERPSGPRHQHVEVQMGEAVLSAGKDALSLETGIGVAVLSPGTKLSLIHGDQETRYEVVVGLAHFESKQGDKTDVAAGESVVIGIGPAKLERYVALPEASASASPVPAASAEVPAPPPAVASGTGDIAAHVTGNGAVVREPGAAAFARLPPGEGHLVAGSTLRLSQGSSADVTRADQHVTLRGAGEFVVGATGKPFIVTQGGGVSLTGSASEVEIAVPGGTIVAKLGARGDVGVARDTARVTVTDGVVELRSASGTEELRAGEEGTLGRKGAEVQGRGPAYADLVVSPGTSFAVHDPHPPTSVGFATAARCPEGATVQIGAGPRVHSATPASVNVLIASGAHHYAIRCVGAPEKEIAATGSIAVLADSGTARIPRTAADTAVDTDGRSYTVLYQNLLPKLTVRWPGAPAASSYTLRVTSPGGKGETVSSSGPIHSFPSGAFREGEHHAVFEGGGARSKDTRIEIKFDNAAPTATLTSPPNGFAPGSTVTVAGAALEGWKISVNGKDLPLDDQLRFSGEAAIPGGQRALAIEFVHPKRGLHYYLRRASSP